MKIPSIYTYPKLGERVYRITMTILLPLYAVANAVVAATRFEEGDVSGGWASTAYALTNLGVISFLFWAWPHADRLNAWRRQESNVHVSAMDSIPVYPSRETIDPRHYAMMKAIETGEPVHIYQDNKGVWRDSETNEQIPAQGGDIELDERE